MPTGVEAATNRATLSSEVTDRLRQRWNGLVRPEHANQKPMVMQQDHMNRSLRPYEAEIAPPTRRGRRSRPPLSDVVQERHRRRHLHRLFGLRNLVSANDREASRLAQLAGGRPPAAEII